MGPWPSLDKASACGAEDPGFKSQRARYMPRYVYLKLYNGVVKALNKACKELGVDIAESRVEELVSEPPREEYGDLSTAIAFYVSKVKGIKPVEAARELAGVLDRESIPYLSDVTDVGPYLNFKIDCQKYFLDFFKNMGEIGSRYGEHEKKKFKVIVEHTSVNPSGPINIGRVRGSFIGDSIARILKACGYDVETQYYVNDLGRQSAIIYLGIKSGVQPEVDKLEKRYGRYAHRYDFKVMSVYSQMYEKCSSDGKLENKVREIIRRSELPDVDLLHVMRENARRCLREQLKTLERVGVKFDKIVFESEFVEDGSVKKVIEDVKRLPNLEETSDGAYAIDLSKHGIKKKNIIVVRSDGTSVYLTRDLAYHYWKLKRCNRAVNVLGEDHKLEFSVLKTILKLLGKVNGRKLDVIHFSFVLFEGEKLSTRKGIVIPVDVVIDKGVEKVLEMRNELKEEEAEKIAVGSIRFEILKQSLDKPIDFRWDKALNFEGDTGAYIQYSAVRAKRILEKANFNHESFRECLSEELVRKIDSYEEISLLKYMSKFPFIVRSSAEKLDPGILARFALQLAKRFSLFYNMCPVLDEREKRSSRLCIVYSFSNIIEKAMALLGIPSPSKM